MKRISKFPAILLLAGFSSGVILAATLILSIQAVTKGHDPIFAVLSGLQDDSPGWSALPRFDLPGVPRDADHAPQVASLAELLPGLEAKAAANPDGADLQILLAQTYLELGQAERGQALLDKLYRRFPQDDRIPFVRAKILMEGNAVDDLRKAIHLFEESVGRDPAKTHLARLYQGQILVKLGERERAVKVWRDFVATLPLGDERRTVIEAELAKTTLSEGMNSL
jgi:cytochrome c-type biogenesis protein CcmH/NrfG